MAWLRPPERDIGTARALLASSLALVGVFGLLLLALALLERLGLDTAHVPRTVVAAAAGLVALTAFLSPVRRPADWAVADREIAPVPGGLAGAAALAGLAAIALPGVGAAALAAGLMLGAALAAMLLAPGLRRFGGYGFGDLLAARFGMSVRLAVALVAFAASLLLLVASLKAIAPPVAAAFGFTPETATYAAAALIVLMVLPGGARSLVATQGIIYLLIALACLAPAAILAPRVATAGIGADEAALLLGRLASGLESAAVGWLPVAVFAAGAAALPLLLAQAHATPSARSAGLSLVWTLLFAVALVAGWLVFDHTLAEATGAAGFRALGNLLSDAELYAVFPSILVGLVMAGALAALLAAAQAALFSAAGAFSHDIWDPIIDRRAPAGRRLLLARFSMGAVAAGAAWLAIHSPADPPALLRWGLALAAAGGFPPLLLGLWWRRCNAIGAAAATVVGSAIVALACAADLGSGPAWAAVAPATAGGIGMVAAFAAAILGSLATRAPAAERQALVSELRRGRERPPMRERPA